MKVAKGWKMNCIECKAEFDEEPKSFVCSKCGNLLQLIKVKDYPSVRELFPNSKEKTLWRYRVALPFTRNSQHISLGEGYTTLLKSTSLAKEFGLKDLYIKNEGQNPTGSFKDRGMSVAVTRALQSSAKILMCASTGNTSASLAAYSAKAGLKSVVLIPSGKVASGKLVQAMVHGAKIIKVQGDFDKTLHLVLDILTKLPELYLVNSINPYRIEGQKTVAYEIYEQLGYEVPDYVIVPVGNAGNISAIWKGFKEMKEWGIIDKTPRLVGAQAKGAAPIVEAINKGLNSITQWEKPETIATAIRIGKPASWKKAIRAIRESKGIAISVSDDEIVKARSDLASKEGLFVELASATTIAVLWKIANSIEKGSKIVCIATGHGLKDQESLQYIQGEVRSVRGKESLIRTLGHTV